MSRGTRCAVHAPIVLGGPADVAQFINVDVRIRNRERSVSLRVRSSIDPPGFLDSGDKNDASGSNNTGFEWVLMALL